MMLNSHAFISFHGYGFEIASSIVAAKREKDGLWFLPYIFIGTCVLHKNSCFYKTIGIWKGKYACLNIVYFDLAYIRLMHKLNRIFGFLLSLLSENAQPKEKTMFLCIFSFRCNILAILHNFMELSYPICWSCRIFQKMSYLCSCEQYYKNLFLPEL